MKVQCDLANGVFEVKDLDDFEGYEILSEEEFFNSIIHAQDNNKIIGAELSAKMAVKIEKVYGINLIED